MNMTKQDHSKNCDQGLQDLQDFPLQQGIVTKRYTKQNYIVTYVTASETFT